jgi:hypothetical protein
MWQVGPIQNKLISRQSSERRKKLDKIVNTLGEKSVEHSHQRSICFLGILSDGEHTHYLLGYDGVQSGRNKTSFRGNPLRHLRGSEIKPRK